VFDYATFISYLLFAVADLAIYIPLSWFLAKSFRYHRFKVVAFLILIAPFIYSLAYAGSFLNLLWMLIFTPFYGIVVMVLLYPISMMLYYAVSFGSLLMLFLLRKRLAALRKQVT